MNGNVLFSWRALLAAGAAIVLLTALYLKSEIIDNNLHNLILSDIRRIKQYDAVLNENILRTRHDLLTQYDSLVTTQSKIAATLADLQSPKMRAYLQAQDPAVLSRLSQVERTLLLKNEFIEWFKSENANFKNSLNYFPLATSALLQRLNRPSDAALATHFNDLLRDVLMFNLIHRNELRPIIEQHLAVIRTTADHLPDDLQTQAILVTNHAEAILLHKARIDATLAQINSTKLNDPLDTVLSAYQAAHQASLQMQNRYRFLLFAFALFLLAYVIFIVLRLKLSSQALGRANEQLVSEINTRKQAEARLVLYHEVITHANDAIALLDPTHQYQEQNAAHHALLGYSDDALIGLDFAALVGTDTARVIDKAVQTHGHFRGDLFVTGSDRGLVEVELSLFRIDDIRGQALCYVSVQRDISDRSAHIAALEYQARHDALTGLPNRTHLYEYIDKIIHDGEEKAFALMLVDLDRFKEINDTLGHYAGDTVLTQVGQRIEHVIHQQGIVVRLGGDEFAILLRDTAQTADVLRMASQILMAIREPFDLTSLRVEISASIGIALFPEQAGSTSQLMRYADVAMYVAKNSGNGYALYDAELDEHSPRRLMLMTGLNKAIQQNELVLHYQPKLDLRDKSVIGFEALVRWQHPEHGMVPPDQFIPLAEVSDLIRPLTYWVLNQALEQCRHWLDEGMQTRVAVNVSARNFQDKALPEQIAEMLTRHGIAPQQLELEITESAVMSDPNRSLEILQRIHQMGITLSIDDYGTGYSSLAYLQGLPIQTLKIDLSFVRNMLTSKENEVIVQSTIALAHSLGLNVVAEGVENNAILERLAALHCDQAQGYYISRPMDAATATQWLHKNK